VACLWWRTGSPSRVLPDGCADLVWTGAELVVAGPATRPLVPKVPTDHVKLGVRFRVGAAGAALGLPAGELLDFSPAAGDVWPGGDQLADRLAQAVDARAQLGLLTAAVSARIARGP